MISFVDQDIAQLLMPRCCVFLSLFSLLCSLCTQPWSCILVLSVPSVHISTSMDAQVVSGMISTDFSELSLSWQQQRMSGEVPMTPLRSIA